MRSPLAQVAEGRTKALACVIREFWVLNSPSPRRQDSFTRNPTLDECDRLISTGLETRVAKAYQPVGLLPHFKEARWSPQTARTVFNYVCTMARNCRNGAAATGSKYFGTFLPHVISGLGLTATAIFWEEYARLADAARFAGDLRSYWRLLVRHNARVLAFNQKILTLEIRSRLTPEMTAELLPAFTLLYFEIIYEAVLQNMVPKAHRLMYRVFLLRFRHCDFFVGPVCRCCCRRKCSAEFLNAIPDCLWPQLESERWQSMIEGRSPPLLEVDRNNPHYFTRSPAATQAPDWFGDRALQDLHYNSNDPAVRGILRQQVLVEALLMSTRTCLELSLKSEPKEEVATNDFVLQDLLVLSERMRIPLGALYNAQGWEAILSHLDEAVEEARSTRVNEIASHFVADFVCNTDYSPPDEPSANEGLPPKTIAQKFWLDVYDVLKKSYMSPGDEDKLSPCAMNDPPGKLCPLLGAWVRLSIDATVNRTFLEGDLQRLEALMTAVCLELIHQTKHEWPESFREGIDPLLKALRHKDVSAPYVRPQ